MSLRSLVELYNYGQLPLTIGAMDSPHNPPGFPDLFEFALGLDEFTGLLVQMPNQAGEFIINRAYKKGSLLGTAMDDTSLGAAYAADFLGFIEKSFHDGLVGQSVLEIGAGRGYLVKRLREIGAEAIGLEPGSHNAEHWARHGVPVINKPFPNSELPGPFDCIVTYAVLEHVSEILGFLGEVKKHLCDGGSLIVSVPDCSSHIELGDPSMLLHEHWSYFTSRTLKRTLETSGFKVTHLQQSGYGGALYAAATSSKSITHQPLEEAELKMARAYADNCQRLRSSSAERLEEFRRKKLSIGVYVPSRALALLPFDVSVRFFDDDPELHGKYYPPFSAPVESRQSLLDDPVDELWIMSRSFGARIAEELAGLPQLCSTAIVTLDELYRTSEKLTN
jgi:2-polyprenyl-3-methyl-5-hydroxy-6-metoxy-1,4-benzoquinol methylase